MALWTHQLSELIDPAVAKSKATDDVLIGSGVLEKAGVLAARYAPSKRVLVMADTAGFAAAGSQVTAALRAEGLHVDEIVLSNEPLPKASVEEAEVFRAALASDPDLFPISVGSGVINDLVKYAAFQTNRRYMSVATAASMDGYTSAGAPLAKDGFKITIPTRAPIAMLADLDVIAKAPAEMNGWGYGDLAGKVPAGGDWIVSDALGVEPLDDVAWPLVQDQLQGWLSNPDGIIKGNVDVVADLFVGLTAVGFAMEFHGSSRPASGADHQIAHMWEMEGLTHKGRKVSHGAAVGVGCVAALALYDWLLEQDLTALNVTDVLGRTPDLAGRLRDMHAVIPDQSIASKAAEEVRAKLIDQATHARRIETLKANWPSLRDRLRQHLIRSHDMAHMLETAGCPSFANQIGVSTEHLLRTLRGAAFIRRRYTVLDLLHDTGLTEQALAAVIPKLGANRIEAAE